MIIPLGTYTIEDSGEVKNRVLVLGRLIKDGKFQTVGSKATPMLTFGVSPGRGEKLINVKMWSYDAVDYAEIKKGTTIIIDAYEDVREYGGNTYVDYIPLNIVAASEKPKQKQTRKSKVEPENPIDGFTDLALNPEDLPF